MRNIKINYAVGNDMDTLARVTCVSSMNRISDLQHLRINPIDMLNLQCCQVMISRTTRVSN